MSKRVADVLVETFAAAGVRTCYGIVGDTLNRIAHAIDRSEIDWVHMRHEEAGAFAASLHIRIIKRYQAFTPLARGNFGLSIRFVAGEHSTPFGPFSDWLSQDEGHPRRLFEASLKSKSTAQMGRKDAAYLVSQQSREDDRRSRCQIQRKLARHEA